jgi:hypothetical protein
LRNWHQDKLTVYKIFPPPRVVLLPDKKHHPQNPVFCQKSTPVLHAGEVLAANNEALAELVNPFEVYLFVVVCRIPISHD